MARAVCAGSGGVAQGEHAPPRLGAATAPDASAQRVLRVLWAAAVGPTIEHRPLACLSAMALDVTTPQPKGTANLRLGYARRQTLVPATNAATAECVGLISDLLGDGCALGSPVRKLRTPGSDRGVGRSLPIPTGPRQWRLALGSPLSAAR